MTKKNTQKMDEADRVREVNYRKFQNQITLVLRGVPATRKNRLSYMYHGAALKSAFEDELRPYFDYISYENDDRVDGFGHHFRHSDQVNVYGTYKGNNLYGDSSVDFRGRQVLIATLTGSSICVDGHMPEAIAAAKKVRERSKRRINVWDRTDYLCRMVCNPIK